MGQNIQKGSKKLVIGGLYREHRFLKEPDNISADIRNQESRWRRIVAKWLEATAGCESLVIGDMNLDQVTWSNPDQAHKNMVEVVKTEIETKGFFQVIEEITRTWPGVEDSLLDHCWVNCPEKII